MEIILVNTIQKLYDHVVCSSLGFSGDSDSKEFMCDAGCQGSVPVSGRSPEKEMATHSSVLAWKIPWAKEADGLQFMGSQRVIHN